MINSACPIFCYISPAGNNKVVQWIDGLDPNASEAARAVLRIMQRKRIWESPDWKRMSGSPDLKQLGEIRWETENVQYRVIGRLDKSEFKAMIECIHKQKRYDPPDALETAEKRWKEIRTGRGRVERHDF